MVDIETLPLGNSNNPSVWVVFRYHLSLGGDLRCKSFQILSNFHLIIKKTPNILKKTGNLSV